MYPPGSPECQPLKVLGLPRFYSHLSQFPTSNLSLSLYPSIYIQRYKFYCFLETLIITQTYCLCVYITHTYAYTHMCNMYMYVYMYVYIYTTVYINVYTDTIKYIDSYIIVYNYIDSWIII